MFVKKMLQIQLKSRRVYHLDNLNSICETRRIKKSKFDLLIGNFGVFNSFTFSLKFQKRGGL